MNWRVFPMAANLVMAFCAFLVAGTSSAKWPTLTAALGILALCNVIWIAVNWRNRIRSTRDKVYRGGK